MWKQANLPLKKGELGDRRLYHRAKRAGADFVRFLDYDMGDDTGG